MSDAGIRGLPENAFRELKEGEVYESLVPPSQVLPEVTFRSILLGIILTIFFSGSIAYLTLKIGTGIEAAIPIAIIAVGLSFVYKRRSSILENVIIMAVGATSGIVVGGSVFTLPALYIMNLESNTNLFQLFFIPFLGAVLGVLLLIPLRKYFVSEMHGKLPFPEATATTEVLVTGEKGGRDAKVLAYTMVLGGIYDFLASALGAWRDVFTTGVIDTLGVLTTKFKAVFSVSTGAAVTGVGYIIGLRFASIMAAGGAFSWLVLIPIVGYIGSLSGSAEITTMVNTDIFKAYVRPMGIGGIFMAGLIGIVKSLPIMWRAFSTGMKELFESKKEHDEEARVMPRTDRDIRMYGVVALLLLMAIGIFGYFKFSVLTGQPNPWTLAIIAFILTFVLVTLFSPVSAYAIATIGTTPISGMTMMTLVIGCIILAKVGLSGEGGMVSALLIGGVVCTALSMSGSLITQFKVAYWLGATPRWIAWANIIGSVVAAAVCSLVIAMLAKVYGFAPSAAHPNPLPSPQANAMAAVVQGILLKGEAPWFFYGVGAMVALVMELIKISPLAFALGMYLPLEMTTPLLVGATMSALVKKSSADKKTGEMRFQRGTLIASGLIAGGALMGVVGAAIEWLSAEVFKRDILAGLKNIFAYSTAGKNWVGLVMVILLCAYIYFDSRRAKE